MKDNYALTMKPSSQGTKPNNQHKLNGLNAHLKLNDLNSSVELAVLAITVYPYHSKQKPVHTRIDQLRINLCFLLSENARYHDPDGEPIGLSQRMSHMSV